MIYSSENFLGGDTPDTLDIVDFIDFFALTESALALTYLDTTRIQPTLSECERVTQMTL